MLSAWKFNLNSLENRWKKQASFFKWLSILFYSTCLHSLNDCQFHSIVHHPARLWGATRMAGQKKKKPRELRLLKNVIQPKAEEVKKSVCSFSYFVTVVKTLCLILFYYFFSITLTFYNQRFIHVSLGHNCKGFICVLKTAVCRCVGFLTQAALYSCQFWTQPLAF